MQPCLCCQPGPGYIRNQYTASLCSEACPCIQVRSCFSPARVSLGSSSHQADGLVLSLSFVWVFLGFGFAWFGGRVPEFAHQSR